MLLDDLLELIDAQIRPNANQALTGAILNNVLKQMAVSGYVDPATLQNWSNHDLTLTGNRNHSLNGHYVQYAAGSMYSSQASYAPPSGRASFEFYGYGSSADNKILSVFNGSNSPALTITGDRVVEAPYAFRTPRMNSDVWNNHDDTANIAGINGSGRLRIYPYCEFSYLNFTSGSGAMWNNNTDTLNIASFNEDGSVRFYGNVRMSGIPYGNAGISSGMLYYDTAANIAANGDYVLGRKS